MSAVDNTNFQGLTESNPFKIQDSNGDFVLTDTRTTVYVATDIANGTRQVNTVIQSGVALSGSSVSASASATAAGVTASISAFGLLGAALVNVAASVFWTIPDSKQELRNVENELKQANNAASKAEAAEALAIAKLGVKNHYLLLAMGVTQIASASTAIASPTVANCLGYTPALTGTASSIATLATGAALGAVYAARGAVMMKKTYKSYAQVNKFYENFKEKVESDKDLGAAMQLMQEAEKDQTYLSRRVDLVCLRGQTDSAHPSLENWQEWNRTDRIEYLERIDKAVYSAQLKNKIGFGIGLAMFVGGILAIAVSILTGGAGALIIAMISALIFVLMEYTFVTYDSSRAFVWLRDTCYKKPEWLV